MANLLSICEEVHRQIFPESREKTNVPLEVMIATGRSEYAAALWIYRQQQIQQEGGFDMPSDLLTEVELEVKDKVMDISSLNYLTGLPGDLWLQNVGGVGCDCKYVKTTINLNQLLCDDDVNDNDKPYYVQGKKIIFPNGAHKKKITIVYANTGDNLDENIEVNDYVGSKVRDRLMQLYGKPNKVDQTNNQSPDN